MPTAKQRTPQKEEESNTRAGWHMLHSSPPATGASSGMEGRVHAMERSYTTIECGIAKGCSMRGVSLPGCLMDMQLPSLSVLCRQSLSLLCQGTFLTANFRVIPKAPRSLSSPLGSFSAPQKPHPYKAQSWDGCFLHLELGWERRKGKIMNNNKEKRLSISN